MTVIWLLQAIFNKDVHVNAFHRGALRAHSKQLRWSIFQKVKGWKLLTILEKSYTSDVWLGSEYPSISYYTVSLTWLVFLS